ncbi:MAG: hypothetical protein EOO54_06215 [Haliea sp.]|nr:MAG: hypothetical protein EOO54_06215 [Haliea sp.]
MEHLRSIALTVEENEPGQFNWLLLESQGDAVVFDVELECCEAPYPTYAKALKAGYERLAALGTDADRGPRGGQEDEEADPVAQDQYGGNA